MRRTWQATFKNTGARYLPSPVAFWFRCEITTSAAAGRWIQVELTVDEAQQAHASLEKFLRSAKFGGRLCDALNRTHESVAVEPHCECRALAIAESSHH